MFHLFCYLVYFKMPYEHTHECTQRGTPADVTARGICCLQLTGEFPPGIRLQLGARIPHETTQEGRPVAGMGVKLAEMGYERCAARQTNCGPP